MTDLNPPSNTGLSPNVAGALAYLLGPITGILFLVIEKNDRFVRFHAAQAIAVSVVAIVVSFALSIVAGILAFVPILGWLIGAALSLGLGVGCFVLWIVLMYRAFSGDEWELPGIGLYARRISASPALH